LTVQTNILAGLVFGGKVTSISLTVRLGITGHRTLPNDRLIRESIQKVLVKLDHILEHTPHTFMAISPLAEGSDRIFATEVLSHSSSDDTKGNTLEVVLPFLEEEYIRDFSSQGSSDEFSSLLSSADSVLTLGPSESRTAAYEQAGRYVVDNCDVLLVIWNGKPAAGQGGTAEIMEYAGEVGRTIVWIHSESGNIVEKMGDDCVLESLEYYDMYNGKQLDNSKVNAAIREQYQIIEKHAKTSGLVMDVFQPCLDRLLPQFVRADLLARHYQDYYKRAGIAVYALAAVAVATVTMQALFFPSWPQLLWLEVAEIGLILFLLWANRINDWHRQWIDYRFLAERLRGAIFLSMAGMEFDLPRAPIYLKLSRRPDSWIIRAIEKILEKGDQREIQPSLEFESMKKFLLDAWINDQRTFYAKKAMRFTNMHRNLAGLGEILFFITLLVAGIHASGIGELLLPSLPFGANIFASIAIIFPAVGGALGGIRIYREYLRNAERYRHMERFLSTLGGHIKEAKDKKTLADLVRQANEVMMLENQDWRALILSHELSPV
jgi:hypothetical protein